MSYKEYQSEYRSLSFLEYLDEIALFGSMPSFIFDKFKKEIDTVDFLSKLKSEYIFLEIDRLLLSQPFKHIRDLTELFFNIISISHLPKDERLKSLERLKEYEKYTYVKEFRNCMLTIN